MRTRRLLITLLLGAFGLLFTGGLASCGTLHTHVGWEHDYAYDFDEGHQVPPRHHKHKKHKKPKPPKHKKHKKPKHHHDDD